VSRFKPAPTQATDAITVKSPVDLSDVKVSELQDICSAIGTSTSGEKVELIVRLFEIGAPEVVIEKCMETLLKETQNYLKELRSKFSLAAQKVVHMFDCKSAVIKVIKGQENTVGQKSEFDNLFIYVPVIVGIGIEIIQSQSEKFEIVNVFDGSPAWLWNPQA